MTIDEAIIRYKNNAEYERTNGNLQGCLEFRQLLNWLKDYKRLKEKEPKTGWIPCSRELPKKDGDYLVTARFLYSQDDTYEKICSFTNDLSSVDEFDFEGIERAGWYDYDGGGNYEVHNVIAWQELPSKYESED